MIYTEQMNLSTLVLFLIVVGVLGYFGFKWLRASLALSSKILLPFSLICGVVGVALLLAGSPLGGAIAGLAGVFGTVEGHLRHKRDARDAALKLARKETK